MTTGQSDLTNAAFERYRAYLRLAAAITVDPGLRAKFDTSDIVQQTLLEAVRDWGQHRGESDEERLAWLRKILMQNLLDGIRRFRTDKRDAGRERSLEDSVNATEGRLADMIAADGSSPSHNLMRKELNLKIAEAIAALPEDQREALILHQWHGWTRHLIGERLGVKTGAVSRLLTSAKLTLQRSLGDFAP